MPIISQKCIAVFTTLGKAKNALDWLKANRNDTIDHYTLNERIVDTLDLKEFKNIPVDPSFSDSIAEDEITYESDTEHETDQPSSETGE